MSDEEELTKDEIIEQVKATFAPNHCEVNAEFRASLQWVVFDKNQSGRSERFMIDELGDYRTRVTLGEVLRDRRKILEKEGYEFD
jgi:hypothetical protein